VSVSGGIAGAYRRALRARHPRRPGSGTAAPQAVTPSAEVRYHVISSNSGGTTQELAVHIRLRRTGKTKAPTYRVVIADSRSPRNGRFIETIGHYQPLTEPVQLVVNAERARHWIKSGARPTATARMLLVKSGLADTEVPKVIR